MKNSSGYGDCTSVHPASVTRFTTPIGTGFEGVRLLKSFNVDKDGDMKRKATKRGAERTPAKGKMFANLSSSYETIREGLEFSRIVRRYLSEKEIRRLNDCGATGEIYYRDGIPVKVKSILCCQMVPLCPWCTDRWRIQVRENAIRLVEEEITERPDAKILFVTLGARRKPNLQKALRALNDVTSWVVDRIGRERRNKAKPTQLGLIRGGLHIIELSTKRAKEERRVAIKAKKSLPTLWNPHTHGLYICDPTIDESLLSQELQDRFGGTASFHIQALHAHASGQCDTASDAEDRVELVMDDVKHCAEYATKNPSAYVFDRAVKTYSALKPGDKGTGKRKRVRLFSTFQNLRGGTKREDLDSKPDPDVEGCIVETFARNPSTGEYRTRSEEPSDS